MKGQQTVGSQALEMTVNPKTLEVNWSQSKLKDMNQYANEFAVFIFNRSEEKQIRFFNSQGITAREYRNMERLRLPYEVSFIRMKVPASVEIRQGDFAAAAECE